MINKCYDITLDFLNKYNKNNECNIEDNKDNEGSDIKNKTIGQIKNVIQEKQVIQKSSDNKKKI